MNAALAQGAAELEAEPPPDSAVPELIALARQVVAYFDNIPIDPDHPEHFELLSAAHDALATARRMQQPRRFSRLTCALLWLALAVIGWGGLYEAARLVMAGGT